MAVKLTVAECEIAAAWLPALVMLKLYACEMPLETETVKLLRLR
jgi:hypothetical protein